MTSGKMTMEGTGSLMFSVGRKETTMNVHDANGRFAFNASMSLDQLRALYALVGDTIKKAEVIKLFDTVTREELMWYVANCRCGYDPRDTVREELERGSTSMGKPLRDMTKAELIDEAIEFNEGPPETFKRLRESQKATPEHWLPWSDDI